MASGQVPATVRISVFLVDSDLNIKPVPRHALSVRRDDTGEAVRAVTGLDGKVELNLPPGGYTLESERPTEFQGKSYRWKRAIRVNPGETVTVELSVDEAITERLSAPPAAAADLPSLFREWQGSVVTVWSETGHGSGFVIDQRGLIATNQHVVGLADYAAVQFSDTVKVPAQIVSRSPQRDVAILRVNPKSVADVTPVQLALFRDGTRAVEGQQVFTIGSPLNQRKIMTAGIISKIEPHAIISDININHGNSGGPLFTTDGRVIGITTFGDFSDQGGPGVSGIVKIDEAADSIAEAKAGLAAPPPAFRLLPVEPTVAFPVEGLEASLQARPIRPNDYTFAADDFEVTLITPILTKGIEYQEEQAALKEKAKRTSKNIASTTKVDPFADFKNWAEYLGEYRPVLIIDARPKLVEGFWSSMSRGLAASRGLYAGPAQVHFKADFSRMALRCGDQPVEPIHPGKVEHRVSESNAAVKVNDVTFEGFYTYGPDAISPQCGTVTLELYSEKDPQRADVRMLSAKLVDRIWNDFAPLRSVKK